MDVPVLSSTFFLTLLLMVGFFFFIRASAKDRTEQLALISPESDVAVLESLKQYFEQRAYQATSLNPEQREITWEGVVRPSVFIAVFLVLIAGCAWLCLGLVLSLLYPALSNWFYGLVLLAPLAGIYYWRKAERVEAVRIQLLPSLQGESVVSITAHRDELIQIQRALPLKVKEEES
jgi:hypothetical protein